jgi:hypothetical protein
MVMLSFNPLHRLTIRFVLIIVVTIAIVFGWGAIAHSQLPSLPTAASNDPHKPPESVTRLGEYEIANVNSPLDKNLLFKVTLPLFLIATNRQREVFLWKYVLKKLRNG